MKLQKGREKTLLARITQADGSSLETSDTKSLEFM